MAGSVPVYLVSLVCEEEEAEKGRWKCKRAVCDMGIREDKDPNLL